MASAYDKPSSQTACMLTSKVLFHSGRSQVVNGNGINQGDDNDYRRERSGYYQINDVDEYS